MVCIPLWVVHSLWAGVAGGSIVALVLWCLSAGDDEEDDDL